MKCSLCGKDAVFGKPYFCEFHFKDNFTKTVEKTISDYGLLSKKDKVIVGVSGGKDSLAVLFVLKDLGYDVTGLLIDEGIAGYRDKKIEFVAPLLKTRKIPLKIVSFEQELGYTLDDAVKLLDTIPCTICGVFRRYLLNRHARGFDAIATGHNTDDESQAIMMNLFKNTPTLLARQGPLTGTIHSKGFVKRIKPLYYLTEKETMTYTFLEGLTSPFIECTHVTGSFRAEVRDLLNEQEILHPGTKKNILTFHKEKIAGIRTTQKGTATECSRCGEPTAGEICQTCLLVSTITKAFKQKNTP